MGAAKVIGDITAGRHGDGKLVRKLGSTGSDPRERISRGDRRCSAAL